MGALLDRAVGLAYRTAWRMAWRLGHRQRQAAVRIDPSIRLPRIEVPQ